VAAIRARRALWIVVLGLALAPAARADGLGSWSPLPSMNTPRYGAVAAPLGDGRVLVAGGIDGSGNATASAEVYDPTTNAWTPAAPMGSARAFATAATLSDGRVLVAGGDVGGSPSASVEIYDGTTDTWSGAAPMEYAREGAAAAALPGGDVWVAGGGSYYVGTEVYSPASNSWSQTNEYWGISGAVAVPMENGNIFVGGGWPGDFTDPLSTVELDTDTGFQNAYANALGAGDYEASAAALSGGRVVVAGGSASGSDPSGLASAEIYEPNLDSSAVASMSTPRYGAVAASLPDGRVLVAGGEGPSGALAGAEAFTAPVLAPPVNTLPPAISDGAAATPGEVRVGEQVTGYGGRWSDEDPANATSAYQWQVCRSTCENVGAPSAGQGPAPYTVAAADVGAMVRLVETEGDQGVVASVASNEVGPVVNPGIHLGVPESLLPAITGTFGGEPVLSIPIVRDDASGTAEVAYRVWDPTPRTHPIFTPMSGVLTFVNGQREALISVATEDHSVPILPYSLEVQLYDGSPLPVIAPSQVTIPLSAPAPFVRDPGNPLGLPATPPATDPLAGADFFADYFQSLPGRQALAWSAKEPSAAAKVAVIAREPNTERFGAWNGPYPGWDVARYLSRAAQEEPGRVPMLSTYRVVSGHCGRWSDPPSAQAAYHAWITSLAEGIGSHPAVLFLEMDSLITEGCLSRTGVAVRMHELRDAIDVLSNDPHLVTYLDAGAADALPARVTASLLRRAGVAQIQGFFLNSTHFDWTSKEIAYGEKISRLTGGKHFVINTAENGQGPLRPRHPAKQGNEVLCDPPGRGLGPLPTAHTGYRNVDAFAWIANPGVSGGECQPGAPPSGVFWPALALQLVRHENFRVR
jgi:endoglucanase